DGNRGKNLNRSGRTVRIATKLSEPLGSSFYIDLCLSFCILRDLQLVQRNCTFVIQEFCAFELCLRQALIGGRLSKISKGCRYIRTLNSDEKLTLLHGVT